MEGTGAPHFYSEFVWMLGRVWEQGAKTMHMTLDALLESNGGCCAPVQVRTIDSFGPRHDISENARTLVYDVGQPFVSVQSHVTCSGKFGSRWFSRFASPLRDETARGHQKALCRDFGGPSTRKT